MKGVAKTSQMSVRTWPPSDLSLQWFMGSHQMTDQRNPIVTLCSIVYDYLCALSPPHLLFQTPCPACHSLANRHWVMATIAVCQSHSSSAFTLYLYCPPLVLALPPPSWILMLLTQCALSCLIRPKKSGRKHTDGYVLFHAFAACWLARVAGRVGLPFLELSRGRVHFCICDRVPRIQVLFDVPGSGTKLSQGSSECKTTL